MIDYEILHQADENLFYVLLDGGQRAYLKYRYSGSDSAVSQVDFYNTFVPDGYRGKGLAVRLVSHGFGWAEEQGLYINTSCWYAAKVYQRRPQK